MTNVLEQLSMIIKSRRHDEPDTSWTAKLLSQGVERCAKKFGEEAVEAALAGVSGNRDNLKAEAADVLYHLLVLLEAAGVDFNEVQSELKNRMKQSGVAEKTNREG